MRSGAAGFMHMADDTENNDDFEGMEEESISLLGEFVLFLRDNKKFWLLPIIVLLLLLGLLVILGGSSYAPFIYTLF